MIPLDMTIDYKVRSFLHLHSDFWYNSLGSTCTFHYLLVGANVSQNASLSKLNFQFIDSPTMLHWKGHNSSIQNVTVVNVHLMESLFDKLSNRSSPTSRHAVVVSVGSYIIIIGLLFTLVHLLRWPARVSNPSQRSSPTRVRVCLSL
jgi:hypothetical protein